jgi:hypothetical protein
VWIVNRYEADKKNTKLTSVFMMNIGGINPSSQKYEGIHWHVSPHMRVRYYASDESRMDIPCVIKEEENGKTEIFVSSKDFTPPEGVEPRTMDCLDCHNRPTHIFDEPAWAVDASLDTGRIPPALPWAKKTVLEAIQKEYPGHEEAAAGIEKEIRQHYAAQKGNGVEPAWIDAAVQEAVVLYRQNVFPSMKIHWNTYPDHIGHTRATGCYRCHTDEHESEQGNVISQDCELCHSMIALEEEEPEILDQLYGDF